MKKTSRETHESSRERTYRAATRYLEAYQCEKIDKGGGDAVNAQRRGLLTLCPDGHKAPSLQTHIGFVLAFLRPVKENARSHTGLH